MGYNEAKFLNRKIIFYDDGIRSIRLFSYGFIKKIIKCDDEHYVLI